MEKRTLTPTTVKKATQPVIRTSALNSVTKSGATTPVGGKARLDVKSQSSSVPRMQGREMPRPYKPLLGADVRERIRSARYEIDKTYWARLQSLVVLPEAYIANYTIGTPIPPTQPRSLYRMLGKYACDLFDAESNAYPHDDKLEDWLWNLAEEIKETIKTTLWSGHLGALTFHATHEQMEAAVSDSLQFHVQARIAKVSNTPVKFTTESAQVIRDRQRLRASYFETFPPKSFKVIDVCWAANQRYSELKRWMHGKIREDSTPDRAFKRIFRSKKPPAEYRLQPRPPRWR